MQIIISTWTLFFY